MQRKSIEVLALLLLAIACSQSNPRGEDPFTNDPVFQDAQRDPELRKVLNSKKVRDSMADPQFRRQLRTAVSEKLYPFPDTGTVENIEKLLTAQSCIGEISRWNRVFANGIDERRGGIDTTIIRFVLREAGSNGIAPGRRIVAPNELAAIDDRSYTIVYGMFDKKKNHLTVNYCGPNHQ